MRMTWLVLLVGLVAAKADACSIACSNFRNLTLQSVMLDGQPLADTSAWQRWQLTLLPSEVGWHVSGAVFGPCPLPAAGIDNCGDATAHCPEPGTAVQDAGAAANCALDSFSEVWDAK